MKSCIGCRYANWEKTKIGRLHPSGKGVCTYRVKFPVLPASMSWTPVKTLNTSVIDPSVADDPRIFGGYINRHKKFDDHCPCYQE